MSAIRQIYENMPAIINVPHVMQNRKAEIIIFPLDEESAISVNNSDQQLMADAGALEFAGCLPDFPEREPQGEYEVREEFQ